MLSTRGTFCKHGQHDGDQRAKITCQISQTRSTVPSPQTQVACLFRSAQTFFVFSKIFRIIFPPFPFFVGLSFRIGVAGAGFWPNHEHFVSSPLQLLLPFIWFFEPVFSFWYFFSRSLFFQSFMPFLLLFLAFLWLLVMNHDLFVLFFLLPPLRRIFSLFAVAATNCRLLVGRASQAKFGI